MRYLKISIIYLFVLLLALSCSRAIASDGVWLEDYEKALEISRETDKPILINFTGSDWCIWCMRLDEEVFSQAEFLSFVDENLILLKLDFPQQKFQTEEMKIKNRSLMTKYEVRGFPTIILIDKEENVMGITGYREGGAKLYVEHLGEMIF